MKDRKTEKANLEKRKGLFFQVGLVLTLTLVLVLFNWRSYEEAAEVWMMDDVVFNMEEIPITVRPPEPPPTPPAAPPDVLTIVEDEIEIEEITLESTELTEDTEIALIEEVAEQTDEVFSFINVENQPVFPGCENEPDENSRRMCFDRHLAQFARRNHTYPEIMRQMGAQGKSIVEFVIQKDGSIGNVRIIRSSGYDDLDREAMRIVKLLPKLTPAKVGGRPVKMMYSLPIEARLE